jgi:serine/arginine repetitive matrix protein 2
MKDTEKERQRERERAWNRPVSRSMSHTSFAGQSTSPGPGHPRLSSDSSPHSREHSRAASPSGSVRSQATEEEEEKHERERNWGSPHPTWHRHPASPIPGPSSSRPRTQSTHMNGSESHNYTQAQNRHIWRSPSQSSLHSGGSSRASSPAGPVHRPQTTRKDEAEERERNWGSRQQTWNHARVHKRAASPNPALSHSRIRAQSLESDSVLATSNLTRLPNGSLKKPRNGTSPSALAEHAFPRHAVLPSEADQPLEPNGTSNYPISTSPRPKLTNGYGHDRPVRAPSRLPRPDSPLALAPSNVNGNVEGNGVPPEPAHVPHHGWQFPRNRPQLPDFEPDTTSSERSPSPVHRPTSRIVDSAKPSHIPVRPPGQVPKVEIRWNVDAKTFTRGHKRATTEFTEANGAIPPNVQFQPEPEREPEPQDELLRGLWQNPLIWYAKLFSYAACFFLESDESTQDALTPVVRPIEIPPVEALQSTSPAENPSAYPEHVPSASAGEDAGTSVPSVAPPLDTTPSSTPPRRSSFSTSKIELQTPSPPKGLLELPGPPSSSEDDTGDINILSKNDGPLNLTIMKTPRPPGAWAATPAPARSQTPQPTSSSFTSTKHSRARSNSLPQSSVTDVQGSALTPSSALSLRGTLPVRTPALPGGWFSTPGSLRRKSLMKVRFENGTSDSAISDADSGAKKDGKPGVELPVADWDATSLPRPSLNTSESMSEPSFNDVKSSSPAPGSLMSANGDGQEEGHSTSNMAPDASDNLSSGSPPCRKSRRSSVRLVDEYGRAKEDPPITPSRKDVRDQSASMRMPGGGPLKTPRNASVRMLDAMGHEVDEPSEQNDSEDTVTEVRYSRQEALQRMKRAVAELQEGLSSVDG